MARSAARGRDMVISLAVLFVPVVLVTWFFTHDPAPEVEAVDVAPVLAEAEAQSPYPVLHPEALEWTPVRVAWAADGQRWITDEPAVGNSWQVGYLAPEGTYVGLQQRDRAPDEFLAAITRDGAPGGETTDAAGLTWQHWVSADGRTTSLVWRDGDLTAAITADADFDLLAAFAGTLTSST
ncbi:MAG: DUF4245 domain-containing protein [Arachnia sp.]